MVVKGNQATLLAECAAATAEQPAPTTAAPRPGPLGRTGPRPPGRARPAGRRGPGVPWPSARQVLRLHRRRVDKATGAVVTDETVYAVTSLTPEQAAPAALLRLWRRHWTIENRLHWVRDVVFAEDASTTRTAHAPQALAALRNLALSLLHRWRHRHITAARQYYATHPAALFRRLGSRRQTTLNQPWPSRRTVTRRLPPATWPAIERWDLSVTTRFGAEAAVPSRSWCIWKGHGTMRDRSIAIIGAGVAGLATGCYAQMNGYRTHIFEMHGLPGGVCTSWRRDGYVFDGCLQWLMGSRQGSPINRIWQELGALAGREVVDHDEFLRIEGRDGRTLVVYTDADRLERHLRELAPADAAIQPHVVRGHPPVRGARSRRWLGPRTPGAANWLATGARLLPVVADHGGMARPHLAGTRGTLYGPLRA